MAADAGALAIVAVRGSIAAATAAWAAAEYLRWQSPDRFAAGRTVWCAGALLLTVHALAVYHFVHGWSQAAALEHTARQTAALTGLDWSWGLYVNYGFIALWLGDCVLAWRDPARYRRRSMHTRNSVYAVFLFMFVNGAVVFAPWPARAVGLMAVAIAVWSRATARAAEPTADQPSKYAAK
jgi:hypothetical protein